MALKSSVNINHEPKCEKKKKVREGIQNLLMDNQIYVKDIWLNKN